MRRPSGEKSGRASLASESGVRLTRPVPSLRIFQMSTSTASEANGGPTMNASHSAVLGPRGPPGGGGAAVAVRPSGEVVDDALPGAVGPGRDEARERLAGGDLARRGIDGGQVAPDADQGHLAVGHVDGERRVDEELTRGVALEHRRVLDRSRAVGEEAARGRIEGRRPVVASGVALDPRVGPVGPGGHQSPTAVAVRGVGKATVRTERRRQRRLVRGGDRVGARGGHPTGSGAIGPGAGGAIGPWIGGAIGPWIGGAIEPVPGWAIRPVVGWAVDGGAVNTRLAVALRVEEDALPVRRPRRGAVPALVPRQAPYASPVRLHHVQLAGEVRRPRARAGARRHRRVAAAGEENARAVGREGGVVVSRRVARQVARLAGRGRVLGPERHLEHVGVAVAGADEEQAPAVRRDGRRVLHGGALDQRPRLGVAVQVEHVEVGAAGPLGGEHDPAPVGRDGAVVVEAGVCRQPPGLRAGAVEEVEVPVGGQDAAVDDGLPGRLGLLPAPHGNGHGDGDEQRANRDDLDRPHLSHLHRRNPARITPAARRRRARCPPPAGRSPA